MSGDREPTALLGVTGRGAWAVFVLFAVVHVCIALFGIGGYRSDFVALAALALVLGAGAVTVGGPSGRLSASRSWTVLALCTIASSSVWNLPSSGWPGWSSWIWGAVTFVTFMLALRGRARVAWATFGAMTILTIIWSVVVGRGVADGVGFVVRSAALLFVITLFAVLLARTRSAIAAVQLVARERIGAEAAASAALEEQSDRLAQLRQLAVPALRHVVDTDDLTEDDRRRFALIEGALRDQLRAGSFVTPPVADAARRARSRGIRVSLLNDRDQVPEAEAAWQRAQGAVIDQLDAAVGGEVTARVLPEGREALLTIVADDRGRTTRVVIEPGDASDEASATGGR